MPAGDRGFGTFPAASRPEPGLLARGVLNNPSPPPPDWVYGKAPRVAGAEATLYAVPPTAGPPRPGRTPTRPITLTPHDGRCHRGTGPCLFRQVSRPLVVRAVREGGPLAPRAVGGASGQR